MPRKKTSSVEIRGKRKAGNDFVVVGVGNFTCRAREIARVAADRFSPGERSISARRARGVGRGRQKYSLFRDKGGAGE